MLNQLADGKTVRYTNATSATIPAGTPISIFGKCGVAVNPIPAGETGILNLEGGVYQFDMTSAASSAAQGAPVYLVDGEVTITSGGTGTVTAQIGYLNNPVASGATVCKCYVK